MDKEDIFKPQFILMDKMKINLGSGNTLLSKSNQLIGVKLNPKAKKLPTELSKLKPIHRSLGGFAIYKVGRSLKKVISVLDKLRKHRHVMMGSHVYFTSDSKKPVVPNGYIYLAFDARSKKKDRNKLVKDLKLKKDRSIDDLQFIYTVTKESSNPLKVCTLLEASGITTSVIPDFDIPVDSYAFTMPGSPLFPLQWHLENKGAAPGEPKGKIVKGADVAVVKAWQRLGNKGSNKVRLAIVDDGFQLDHPSYVDRVAGVFSLFGDFIETSTGHGTACAALAAAAETPDGIIGVAPNVELYLIEGKSYEWSSHERIHNYCVENEIDIISCSWGNQEFIGGRSPMHDKVWKEISTTKGRKGKGCIVLFAAGNENSERVNVLAKLPNVICVGGTTSADGHWHDSNRGKEVSVSAPAGDWPLITARANFTAAKWKDGKERGPSGHYDHFEGTSASTPIVAGVCALILSANPKLTAAEVKSILERTADKVGNKNAYEKGHSIRFGYGRVNADKAVKEALRMKNPSAHLPDLNEAGGRGLYSFQVKPLPSKGWGIQTGALNEYGNVLKMVDQLQKDFGKRVVININELDGVPNYKTILGPFKTKKEATTFQKKVAAKGIESFVRSLKGLK